MPPQYELRPIYQCILYRLIKTGPVTLVEMQAELKRELDNRMTIKSLQMMVSTEPGICVREGTIYFQKEDGTVMGYDK